MSNLTPDDLLALSDDEFLSLNAPPAVDVAGGDPAPAASDPVSTGSEAGTDPAPSTTQADGDAVTPGEDGAAAPTDGGEGGADAGQDNANTPAPAAGADGAASGEPAADAPKADDPAPAAPAAGTTEIDYKAGYEKLMAPFKANGKTFEPKSVDEVIQLAQMGANYTRKMQELKPHRSTLMMLQNANLLDPNKLSFLIDLDKGDPEAIKKFMKDRNIDPLEIDTSTEPAYLGGDHRVSDADVNFREALEDVCSTQAGQEFVQTVNSTWDNASKEMLYQDPSVLKHLTDQRESGVFDLIMTEVERQRTLGTLTASTPLLQAYMTVGNQLMAEHAKTAGTGNGDGAAPEVAPPVLGTTVATPKSPVAAGDKAAAAAPSRGNATPAAPLVNPLAMSDDEFLAKMENRV